MLINFEGSDNEETSFSETLVKMNNDIKMCSIPGTKNHNFLNLSSNTLNDKDSLSFGILFEENIGLMQLQKNQIFQKKNKTCARKRNKIFDQTEICEEFEVKKRKG